jgi:hypothetical protein
MCMSRRLVFERMDLREAWVEGPVNTHGQTDTDFLEEERCSDRISNKHYL